MPRFEWPPQHPTAVPNLNAIRHEAAACDPCVNPPIFLSHDESASMAEPDGDRDNPGHLSLRFQP